MQDVRIHSSTIAVTAHIAAALKLAVTINYITRPPDQVNDPSASQLWQKLRCNLYQVRLTLVSDPRTNRA